MIFGPLGPPGGPPGVLILVYHFILLPLDRISVKTANTCYQSIFDGSKIEKIKILVNFSHFWTFWAPLLGPRGSSFSLFHSFLLSPHQISVKITKVIYLSKMDGGKILKIQDFGQFWPFLVLLSPVGSPKDPLPLVLEVNYILL